MPQAVMGLFEGSKDTNKIELIVLDDAGYQKSGKNCMLAHASIHIEH